MSDNNSTRKFALEKTSRYGKPWIDVLFRSGQKWTPSFLDFHRIIRALAECEEERYPPPDFEGRTRLARFLSDAVHTKDFADLARKYKIPERDGNVIVNAHGADLTTRQARLNEVDMKQIRAALRDLRGRRITKRHV